MGREEIQLTFSFVRYSQAKYRLKQLQKMLKTMTKVSFRPVLIGLGWIINRTSKIAKTYKRLGTTMARSFRSAVFRTMSYSILNFLTMPFKQATQAIRENYQVSLMLGRSAAILSQEGGNMAKTYDNLINLITNTKNTTYLLTKGLADTSFTLAIAGVRGKKFSEVLGIIDKMAAITGSDAKSISLDFIRLTNAFQISGAEMSKAADILIKGISNAVIMLPDLLNAVKMLGPTWVMAFGPGIKSLKEFTAAVMALGDVGLRGGQGARYLNRFILGLIAPSQKTAAIMRAMGFNVYEATGNSKSFGNALDKVATDVGKLQLKLDELTKKQAEYVAMGKSNVAINQRISAIQDEMAKKTKALEVLYTRFVHAGGKLKPIHQILNDFADALANNNDRALEMFQLFKRLFQLRGLRATALIKDIRAYNESRREINRFSGALSRLVENTKETWSFTVREAQASSSKLKLILTEMIGAPILKAINKAMNDNVITPIVEAFKRNDYWQSIRNILKDKFKKVFSDLGTSFKDLFLLLVAPEQMVKPLKRGTQEWKDAIKIANLKIVEAFRPLFSIIGNIFRKIGRLAGEGFMATFEEAIAVTPLLGRFTELGRRIRHAMKIHELVTRNIQVAGGIIGTRYRIPYKTAQKVAWQQMKLAIQGKPTTLPQDIVDEIRKLNVTLSGNIASMRSNIASMRNISIRREDISLRRLYETLLAPITTTKVRKPEGARAYIVLHNVKPTDFYTSTNIYKEHFEAIKNAVSSQANTLQEATLSLKQLTNYSSKLESLMEQLANAVANSDKTSIKRIEREINRIKQLQSTKGAF